jgi:hypothetical protein
MIVSYRWKTPITRRHHLWQFLMSATMVYKTMRACSCAVVLEFSNMSFLLSLLALGGSVTGSWLSAGEAHNVVDFSISAVEAAERAAAANIATLDDLVLVDACHRQVGRSQVRTTL